MSTTVIVIKGNSSQSLLDRIADALKSEKEKEQDLYKAQATQFINEMNAVLPRVAIALQQQEQPIARQKAPYTKRYHFDENQERLVKQYLRKNKTFKAKNEIYLMYMQIITNAGTIIIKQNIKKNMFQIKP